MINKNNSGFTIVELLVVIAVIAILTAISIPTIAKWRERTYLTRANTEISIFVNATKLYVTKYNTYPVDASDADIPSNINEFISSDDSIDNWPNAPWPGSMYDYDAWDIDGDGTLETYQMSIRFCTWPEASAPNGAELCKSRAPKEDWAVDFNSNSNSYYYCIKGYCRPNSGTTWNYPGYCINCPDNKGIKKPGET